MPTGLSSSSAPEVTSTGSFPRPGGLDQARQAVAALHRLVVLEAQLGRGVELDALRELRAQEAGGALQSLTGVFKVLFLKQSKKHLGVREVRRHIHARNGDHADAWIPQLALQKLGQLPLDEVTQLLRPSDGFLALQWGSATRIRDGPRLLGEKRALSLIVGVTGSARLPRPRTPRTGRPPSGR